MSKVVNCYVIYNIKCLDFVEIVLEQFGISNTECGSIQLKYKK